MKKTAKILSLLLILALLLASAVGCTPEAGETPISTEAGTTDAAVTDTGTATEAGTTADTLTVASTYEIDDLNPFTNQQSAYLAMIVNNCLETLIYFSADMEYEPGLASDYTVSDDGLTYTFALREGVTYHNGEPFTSADVKYTFDYIMDEANGAYRGAYFTTVASIECPDEYTVVFTLSSTTPAFLDAVTQIPIISESQDPATYSTSLNGTGAFQFVSYTASDNITFEQFAGYRDAANVKLGGYVIKFFADQTTELTSLQAGDVDLVYELTGENAGTVAADSSLKVVQSASSTSTYLFEIGLHKVEAFRDPNVLKAMFMVLDTESIAESVFYGYASTSYSPLCTSAKYYVKSDDIAYDVEAAKALLETTDYADGFEFTMDTLSGTYESIAVIWKQALTQLGITMNIEVEDVSVWLENYLNKDYDMISNSYSMAGSDPAIMMSQIIAAQFDYQCSEDIIPGLQELISEGASTAGDTQRAGIYGDIQEQLLQYMPVYTYLCIDNLYAAVSNLEGVAFDGMAHFNFTYAYFA